jgi:MFS family permease
VAQKFIDVNSQGDGDLTWTLFRPWQRWGYLAVLFFVTTSNYFDYYVLSVLLVPIKTEFHVSDTMLGLLSGFGFALLFAVGAFPIAYWADRGNRRSIMALTLTVWSVMTAVCGLAQSFWQLAGARLAVGLVEPGALPPAQSLIADYFPPERRATAIAVLTQGGSSAGWLMGVVLGGYIAATHGWRIAFLVAGLPGVALALIVRITLAEPRCRFGYKSDSRSTESARQTLSQLRYKRTFLYSLIGISVYAVFSYGIGIFLPSFMIRALNATLLQVSLTWGCAISAANMTGAIVGGWLGDRLSRRDVRWYAWLPAIACLMGAPLYWLALSAHKLSAFIVTDIVAETILAIGPALIFAAIQAVCGSQRRAMATALVLFSINLIGAGVGPLLAGVLSDWFALQYGLESLRYSLAVMVFFLWPAGVAFSLAARTILRELEHWSSRVQHPMATANETVDQVCAARLR